MYRHNTILYLTSGGKPRINVTPILPQCVTGAHFLELFQKLGRRRYLLRVRRLAAAVIVGEDVPHGALGELYLFTVPPTDPEGDGLQMRPEMPPSWVGVRSTDPDVLVIIADRHGLAGRGPGCPCGVGRR